jgi:hypothetical protein
MVEGRRHSEDHDTMSLKRPMLFGSVYTKFADPVFELYLLQLSPSSWIQYLNLSYLEFKSN